MPQKSPWYLVCVPEHDLDFLCHRPFAPIRGSASCYWLLSFSGPSAPDSVLLIISKDKEPAWNGISFKSKPGLCASQVRILPGGTHQQCIVVKDAEEV
jgi:hypothetical protein